MNTPVASINPPTIRSTRALAAIGDLLSWAVATVFAVSGFAHLSNPVYFLGSVFEYGLFPSYAARLIATILPWTEIGIASMLVLVVFREIAFGCAIVLSIGFVGVQCWAISQGLKIDCGCFGSLSARPIGAVSLSLACGMVSLSAIGAYLYAKESS